MLPSPTLPSPASAPTCTAADLYIFPSLAKPVGEVIYLKFGVEECAKDLSDLTSSATAAAALVEVAEKLLSGDQQPAVPIALLDAFKPVCSASCSDHLSTCKRGETGKECDKKQTDAYVSLFAYICLKEPSVIV